MNGDSLVINDKRKEKELDEKVKTIETLHLVYSKELKGLDRSKPSDMEKATRIIQRHTRILKGEIAAYMELGKSEEEALERILPKAYAVVRLASEFLMGKAHYKAQLKGGILLHEGYASEMATGEGKTLTASLPAYLNALTGKGVHILTTNPYLAKRDFEEMSKLFEFLGLSCGLVEERAKISEEEIEQKTLEILKVEIDDYTKDAKTPEEKIAKTKQFLSRNRTKYAKARQAAEQAIRTAEIQRRKKAYQADITYASSSAIAFDYLYDVVEKDPNRIVQRTGAEDKANFVIVDEMDAVLIDDAMTPFTLSERLSVSEEEIEAIRERIGHANGAMAKIEQLHKDYFAPPGTSKPNRGGIKISQEDSQKYEILINPNTEQGMKADMTAAIIINPKTSEYKITTMGETFLFQHYCLAKVNKILANNREKIIKMQNEGDLIYKEGYDYTLSPNRITMEPRAFAHLVMSGEIPELTEAFNNWATTQYAKEQAIIDNSVRAWFFLQENVDYKLATPSTIPPNTPEENKTGKVIQLVMNGRTAEGRVYSNGLQQAIEAKERTRKGATAIIESQLRGTAASIPTSSFFSRYHKFSGMTGTTSPSIFRNIYGLETFKVPREKEKQSIDHGDRFYATQEEKREAIFQEVLISWKKGQPVLLSTTSIKESEELHRFLMRRFREEGYESEIKDIPVLNANVEDLEREAQIVSRAGLPRAITISTEMAGRGTDIKLGGELMEKNQFRERYVQMMVNNAIRVKAKEKTLSTEEERRLRILYTKQIQNSSVLDAKVSQEYERLENRREQLKKQVTNAGGLKVIGSGHFTYGRVDRQVKGRCGRQGDPGETIFFNDPSDLEKVGVPRHKIEKLKEKAVASPIIDNPQTDFTPVGDLIYEAQARTESEAEHNIKISQEIEREISVYRNKLRSQQEQLKLDTTNQSYVAAVEFMIEETVKAIIIQNKKRDINLENKTRLRKDTLDYDEIASLAREFMGIEIDDFSKFRTVGDLRRFLTEQGLEKFEQRMASLTETQRGEECKKVVDMHLHRTWEYFEGYVEAIKNQGRTNGMIQVKSELPPQFAAAYGHCVESAKAVIVREMINPNYQIQLGDKEAREELVPVRVTSTGVEKVSRDFDQQYHETQQEQIQEAPGYTSSVKNMLPRKKLIEILVNANRIHLNRDLAALGDTRDKEEVVSMDFGDSAPKPKR